MSSSSTTAEHLVIGAGLAGSMAALGLASAGRDVLLIERESTTGHKVCGEFLSTEAVAYLQQVGIDPLALGASPIQNLRLSCVGSTVESRLPFVALSLSRQVLDSALLQRAGAAGARIQRGTAVDSLAKNDCGWSARVSTTDNPAIASNERRTVQVKSVFLANGKHDLRGWPRPVGSQNGMIGFKMHWRLSPDQTQSLRNWMDLFLFRGGYGGLAMVENDIANLCLVVKGSELRRAGNWNGILTTLCRENPHIDLRLRGASALWERPLAISSIPYGYLAAAPSDAWRIGDQAAVIPSFTGDGMAIALHSAALAADCCLSGQTPEHYRRALHAQLKRGMTLATSLSRAMVTPAGRFLAPVSLSLLPGAMSWIASLTRIPSRALLRELNALAR